MRSVTSGQAAAVLAQGGPLAVTEAALPLVSAEVSPAAHYSALGRTLVAVERRAAQHLATRELRGRATTVAHDFGPELRSRRGRRDTQRGHGGDRRAADLGGDGETAEDWSVSVRLTQGGQEIAQLDRSASGRAALPHLSLGAGRGGGRRLPLRPLARRRGRRASDRIPRTADGSFVNLDVAQFPLP